MKKKFLFTFCALVLACLCANAEVTWSLNGGTLTISGTGEMPDFSIGSQPCYGQRDDITNIVVENGVTSIGAWAFYEYDHITSVSFGSGVTTIGAHAFQYTGLTSLDIPSNVKDFGDNAFFGCSKLNSVSFHSGVTNIGRGAFENCSHLNSVTFYSFPKFGEDAFKNVQEGCTFNLVLNDDSHPYVANTTDNAPVFTSATYGRRLSAGHYGTIVLPFVPTNVTDFKFYTLKSVDGTSLTFSEVASGNVKAGVPYLYENAVATPATEMPAATPAMTVAISNPAAVSGWQMKGVFQYTEFNDPSANIYVLSDNALKHTTDGIAKVNPFRAYFEGASHAAKMEINFEGDGETTGICSADAGSKEHVAGSKYNLQGVKVNEGYKGVVISNGKKFLLK